jgi:transcription-repair coupling factor (superfamily II helicase)
MSEKIYLSGIGGAAKARYLFEYAHQNSNSAPLRAFAFVEDDDLEDFYSDLSAFFNQEKNPPAILLFPSNNPSTAIASAEKIKNLKNFIVCADEGAFETHLAPPDVKASFFIQTDEKYRFEDILSALIDFGYERVSFVEDVGQFAVRGEIIDLWVGNSESPIRILFEFNAVESIRFFDPITQKSNDHINSADILPVASKDYTATIMDYFEHLPPSFLFFDYKLDADLEGKLSKYNLLINDPLNPKAIHQDYKNWTGFSGNIKFFMETLKDFANRGLEIKIFCANEGEKNTFIDLMSENNFPLSYQTDFSRGEIFYLNVEFLHGLLSNGFYHENKNLVVVSSREALYKRKPVNFPKIKSGLRIENVGEISAGDYVVHEKYGIGRYAGLKKISRADKTSEYLCIEYAKGDKLYVPPDNINKVKKYIGVEGARPKLYPMDGFAWERVKARAREEAARFAKELLDLYTQRSLVKRDSLNERTNWEKDFIESFPYQETPDQLKAIGDIENDLQKPYPMERLICGDVGYGKTEVAARAAFKFVQNGKQVAFLAPTTVLAQQHFNTLNNRISAFAVKVEVLSRFQSPADRKKITENLSRGKVDIVVGTHILLQPNIKFADLGLLIIDEEHRFGVKQKEHIKEMKKNVDILMLSATPIPRTLSSALSGFRDMSIIETAPPGRLSIETSVSLYDENLIKKIISAELSREGQVFYVYNDVAKMATKLETLKALAPAARIAVLHGQMPSKNIEKIMWEFLNRKIDVLLASTIIESGLDIPTVNTMIVEDAQNFGLSQLYQLRGRVGREKKKAYCYLFYDDDDLSEEAIKRLEAMKEFSSLGSGFRLAMKDLEIRGAGGILSKNQHGFARDIGYDMFTRLIEQEGKKVKGFEAPTIEENTCEINLNMEALIPDFYIEDEDMRILFYRRLTQAICAKDVDEIEAEFKDRFGKIPQETQNLFDGVKTRIEAQKLSLERIWEDGRFLYFNFRKNADFSKADIPKLIADFEGAIEFMQGKDYGFKLEKEKVFKKFLTNEISKDLSLRWTDFFLRKLKIYLGV